MEKRIQRGACEWRKGLKGRVFLKLRGKARGTGAGVVTTSENVTGYRVRGQDHGNLLREEYI